MHITDAWTAARRWWRRRSCAGLPLVQAPNPLYTTTYGVGELVLAAAGSGAERIIVGLGGSATNDGGCGMAAALGVRFYNGRGGVFVPVGGTLRDIARIDCSGIDKRLAGVQIAAMCDIENPLYGPKGAAYVFGPQKGADAAAVAALDAGLRHLCGRGCAGSRNRLCRGPGAWGRCGRAWVRHARLSGRRAEKRD